MAAPRRRSSALATNRSSSRAAASLRAPHAVAPQDTPASAPLLPQSADAYSPREQFAQLRRFFQRGNEGEIQPARPKKITRAGTPAPGGHGGKAVSGLGRRHDFAVGKNAFAEPVHLAFGAFQAQFHLAGNIVPRAPHLGLAH